MVGSVEDEFTDFVKLYEPRLRIALMSAYGPERGRDATAEALAYGWEHWDRVSGMDEPVGYLYRVGQSKSRPRLRARPDPEPLPGAEPWVEPGLPAALESLSDAQRTAVVLLHSEEWSEREVAELMDVDRSTVRSHRDRGLTKLRNALEVANNE